ncbi:hypothetical protein [Parabacteroides gordonii]|uniref:hypothetical protein n=1 Tax=Parabacteroides gordonii TaxID=574930 RepID=UPI00241CE819|nr:hypothetical protein [Parabacteroides gordonii]
MENEETNKKKNEVLIVLNKSTYAHAFESQNLIHQPEFNQVKGLITKQLKIIEQNTPADNVFKRMHNTIAIFGERGTGKTSFLYSILQYCTEEKKNDIATLGLIDPTLLEEKAHIFLMILSLINEEVEKVLGSKECMPDDNAYVRRAEWKDKLRKLAKALPSLDQIGKGYNEDSWQDAEYIMEKGLKDMNAAYHLEDNFHKLIDLALQILDKKAFLITFDDIDINFDKGWRVLETIRKYLTSPKLIILMCGNLALYNLNVRLQQWKQIGPKNQLSEMIEYNNIVYQLENQYMLKVFKTQNRIHLNSLNYNQKWNKITYKITTEICKTQEEENSRSIYLDEAYKKILNRIGIHGETSIRIFRNYLKSTSMRSQINYLMSNWNFEDLIKEQFNIKQVEAFLSRMYGSRIDVDLMLNNPNKLTIGILKYLIDTNNVRDSYQLIPATDNESTNACLTGLTAVFAWSVKENPFLIFDYLLRIGYLRNLIQAESDEEKISQLITYGSFKEDVSFKNIIGLSMAYQRYSKRQSLAEHVKINIQDINNAKGDMRDDDVKALLINLPLCSLRYVSNNHNSYYYSIFVLLAVVAQILKRTNNFEGKELATKEIKQLLMDLQLLRNFLIPKDQNNIDNKEGSDGSDGSEDKITPNSSDKSSNDDNKNLSNLAYVFYDWKESYMQLSKTLPPYLLGRIATRFFFTCQKINAKKEANLGDIMHQSIISFLNTCLVIEGQEYLSDVSKIDQSNHKINSTIFYKNIKNININELPLTKWMIECPLLHAFINIKEILETKVETETDPFKKALSKTKEYNVYEILEKVTI